MPNPGAEEPLEKVTLNLYRADVKKLRETYGWGWAQQVRDFVRAGLRRGKTIEDLVREHGNGN